LAAPFVLPFIRHPEEQDMTRYQCTDCGYIYDEDKGDAHEGFAPGTCWQQIPDDWSCPDCAVRDKIDFRLIGDQESK
jgi:alkane 1-monooxygenase